MMIAHRPTDRSPLRPLARPSGSWGPSRSAGRGPGAARTLPLLLVLLLLAPPVSSTGLGLVLAERPAGPVPIAVGTGAVAVGSPSLGGITGSEGLPYTPSASAALLLQHSTRTLPLATPSVGGPTSSSAGLAYAYWDNSFYVASPPSSVDVVNMSTFTVSNVIPVGSQPFGVSIDYSSRTVLVTNSASNNVSVINGTTQKVVASIAVQSDPTGISANYAYHIAYVADTGTNNVTEIVLGSSGWAVRATIAVGSAPVGVASDYVANRTFVANSGSNTVTVINDKGNSVASTVPVGLRPIGVAAAYIPGARVDDEIYVTNQGSNNVSVLNASATSAFVLANIPIVAQWSTNLTGVVYDPSHKVVWVAAGTVTAVAINVSSLSVMDFIPYDPSEVAYDSLNGDVCVTNSANVTFGCFAFAGFKAAPLSFSESGLPSGSAWNVTIWQWLGSGTPIGAVTAEVTGGSLIVGVPWNYHYQPWYDYNYSIAPSQGYLPSPSSGFVSGSGWSSTSTPPTHYVNVTFTLAGAYAVSFRESGLPAGAAWSTNLSGSVQSTTGSAISYSRSNGSFSYTIATSAPGFVPHPASGSVSVSGASIVVTVAFSTSHYNVTFVESGLPAGHSWGAYLVPSSSSALYLNSTITTIVFSAPNGTYAFYIATLAGYSANLTHGNLSVRGAALAVAIGFRAVAPHPITFLESGLPTGTTWSVVVNGTNQSSSHSTIAFFEPNGSYPYAIGRISGWTTATYNGTVTESGGWTNVSVLWTQVVTFGVTFAETGLPTGTAWNVTIAGAARATTASSMTFSEPNGTYLFVVPPVSVGGVPAYLPSPANGTIVVHGSGSAIAITYTLQPAYSVVRFNESGLPYGTSWYVAIAGQGYASQTSTIAVAERNGTYLFSVGAPSGYRASPSNGTVTVAGSSVTVAISFALSPGRYNVTFNETGLSAGATWSVDLGGTTHGSNTSLLVIAEPNGSYAFSIPRLGGYTSSPSYGNVSVAGHAPPTVTIHFRSTSLYAIDFHEQGLPNGSGWVVSIGGSQESSVTSSLVLEEPNGTYGYVVLPVQGFTTNSSGFVTVHGANVSVTIRFAPQTYPVIVVEVGLPNGTTWSVTVTNASTGFNATFSTNTSALIFYLPNGTYAVSVQAGGYSATLSSARITVAGEPLGGGPTARFSRPAAPQGPAGPFALSGSDLVVAIVGAAVALGLVAATVLYRRHSDGREGRRWIEELTEEEPPASRERP